MHFIILLTFLHKATLKLKLDSNSLSFSNEL